jgi:hypothetical protein
VVTFEGGIAQKADVEAHRLRSRPNGEVTRFKGHAGSGLKLIVNTTHCSNIKPVITELIKLIIMPHQLSVHPWFPVPE